jgi:hypothetical protein
MSVTIDRFELIPEATPAPREAANDKAGEGGGKPKLSRHQLASALRLEHERALRVRAT